MVKMSKISSKPIGKVPLFLSRAGKFLITQTLKIGTLTSEHLLILISEAKDNNVQNLNRLLPGTAVPARHARTYPALTLCLDERFKRPWWSSSLSRASLRVKHT